jgi:uncharacterized protein YegL
MTKIIERLGDVEGQKAFEQLGILVLDGSLSMTEQGETGQSKAVEVSNAVRGLIGRLQSSTKNKNFLLSIVTFEDEAKIKFGPTPVTQLNPLDDYNPVNEHGKGTGTAIGNALLVAKDIAEKFLNESSPFPRSVVIVLLTDGQNNVGIDPLQVADEIKKSGKRITICAVGYGKGGNVDELLLQKIVSPPIGSQPTYLRTYNTEDLRRFFEGSITTIRG